MTEETLFAAALDKATPNERSAFLDEACSGDTALRQRVEALLQSHEHADFLKAPAVKRPAEELAGQAGGADTQGELPSEDGGVETLGFLSPSDRPGALGRLGHYEVLEVIGRGGMGIVLRAIDEKLQRVVAIKVMATQLATNATARKRFTREAQAAAAVTHDHIVTIHAVEETAGHPYLVMQCVSGMSLQERLDRNGPLQLAEIVRIGMQTAAGLAAAHAQGLVHRDVKPANILLENGIERVKITDFGLARAAAEASLTQSGVITGTPYFMSPEQAHGEPVDQRTDLFSLGSVLYAICTGHAPFRASGTMAVLKRVCEETPRPIRETNPEVPDWLVAIIAKLHAKKPADRFQTAKEVAELLGRHLAEVQAGRAGSVSDRSAPMVRMDNVSTTFASPKSHPRKWVLAGVGLVAVALLVGLGWVFNLFRERHGTVVLRAEDVLPQLVGTWSIDVETTLPKPDTAKGLVRFDWVASEKFLRSYTTYDQGSETLTVHRYSGDGANFKRWFLSAQSAIHAIQSGTDGEWDVKTQTMTWRGTLPLFHKITHVERWVDVNYVEITTEIKDNLGAVTLHQTKKMQRTADAIVGPKAPVDPKRPVEFAFVDRMVGNWTSKADVTLAEWGGKKVQSRTTHEAVPILAHRFLESYEKLEHSDRKEYRLFGYDEFRRIYRLWLFGGDGDAMESDGTWDPKEKTLTWTSPDGRFNGNWTFTNDDEHHAAFSVKDAQGRRLFDVTGITRRDGAVAANDGWEPFVLLAGKGVTVRKFDTLAEAVQGASDGDTIEVRGNGPFVCDPIKITQALTIRAGDGFRPVLQMSSNITTGSPLVLEGLELQRLGEKVTEGHDEALVFSWDGSSLYLVNCRFREHRTTLPCVVTDARNCFVRNCEFLSHYASGISWARRPDGKQCVIDNCTAMGLSYGILSLNHAIGPVPHEASVRLTRSTVMAGRALLYFPTFEKHREISKEARAIPVETANNIFDVASVLIVHTGGTPLEPKEVEPLLRRTLAWRDRQNLYVPGASSFAVPLHVVLPNRPKNLTDWKRFWGSDEAASIEGGVKYQGGDLRAKTRDAPDKVHPDDFRLRPDSAGYKAGKDGKDLGADVDLVGPGPAYERWKKTPEYQQWLKDSGQVKK